jgi:hypothetical protein
MNKKFLVIAAAILAGPQANAIIIIPIPNLAFPGTLGNIRDALEKSTDTKALATAGEDKVFGSRYWVWGHISGKMTQSDADAQAMSRCETSLQNAKSQVVGGQPLYNFGSKKCELYKFLNVSLNLPDPAPVPVPVPVPTPAPVASSLPAEMIPAPAPAPEQEPSPAPATAPPPASNVTVPAIKQTQTPISPANTNKSSDDVVQKMKSLDSLFKQGLINRDDYERKKKQFLDAM